jgi:hypothetical protein
MCTKVAKLGQYYSVLFVSDAGEIAKKFADKPCKIPPHPVHHHHSHPTG